MRTSDARAVTITFGMSVDGTESLAVTETEKRTETMSGREKDLASEARPRDLTETNTMRTIVITTARAMKAATVGLGGRNDVTIYLI